MIEIKADSKTGKISTKLNGKGAGILEDALLLVVGLSEYIIQEGAKTFVKEDTDTVSAEYTLANALKGGIFEAVIKYLDVVYLGIEHPDLDSFTGQDTCPIQ